MPVKPFEQYYTKQILIKLTPPMLNDLENEAKKRGIKKSALARDFILKALKEPVPDQEPIKTSHPAPWKDRSHSKTTAALYFNLKPRDIFSAKTKSDPVFCFLTNDGRKLKVHSSTLWPSKYPYGGPDNKSFIEH